jgi:hypothetical protein
MASISLWNVDSSFITTSREESYIENGCSDYCLPKILVDKLGEFSIFDDQSENYLDFLLLSIEVTGSLLISNFYNLNASLAYEEMIKLPTKGLIFITYLD